MNDRPWARHLRPTLEELEVYDVPPADAEHARMHANECPEPWPPHVIDAMADVVRKVELGRYPDTSGRRLRELLGDRHGCPPERIVLGNGSDEIIFILLTALSGGDGGPSAVVAPTPTFVMYGHTARVLGMEVRLVPMTDGFHLDIPAMDIALEGAAVCFLARPNNPTGVLWDADVVHGLMARHPETLFVIDEAYVAYAPGASLWSTQVRPNHIHMQTLSKVGGAALRVGYCIAHPELALALHKVRHPYNVSATSLAFAEALLARFEDEGRALVQRTLAGRDRIRTLLCELEGATVYPSAANLVLVRLPGSEDAPKLRAHLATRGILIKDVSRSPGLERCVRVSVGTAAEIDRLEAALRAWSR